MNRRVRFVPYKPNTIINKRIVERLANQVYELEIHQAPDHRIWAYRNAAWSIEDLDQDIGLFYQKMGLKGLQNIPNVGQLLGCFWI